MMQYDVTQPCDLHETTGCSICSGLDKKLAKEDAVPTWEGVLPDGWTTPPPVPPGYVPALYPGRCAACKSPFPAGEPIRYSNEAGGWVPEVCC